MSYTRLRYHIVTATKRREPSITEEISPILYGALHAKAEERGAKILKLGGVEDHIHIVAAIPPTISLATFVREIKTASSRAIHKEYPSTAFAWQPGYGAFTLNPLDLTAILKYVANQAEHHAQSSIWPPYEYITE